MSEKPITLSWMWRAGEGINGVRIDPDRKRLEWMDDIGCACGDSLFSQTYGDFLNKGAKFDSIPADVLEEVRASVTTLNQG